MRGALATILFVAALSACSSQADTQLEGVKSARSVMAEWALVEEQAAKHRTPSTYTEQTRKQARDELKTAQQELAGQPQAVSVVEAIRMGSPDAAALRQANDALAPLEKQHESS